MNETSMKDDFAKALVDTPGHLVRYVGGLIIAVLSDYSLITLLIFTTLLGFVLSSVLIGVTAFFGLYFVLRLVANVADVIAFHANATSHAAANAGQVQSQAIMQVAGVLARPVTIADDPELMP